MNVRMWDHPATQRNIATLGADGVLFAGPTEGDMACGEFGPGRMVEPATIVAAIGQALAHRELLMENRELANLVRLEMGDKTAEQVEAERLEAIEPGITEVNWGPDGSVLLDPEFQPKD